MAAGEPIAWTQARKARMAVRYPQFNVASPGDVLAVDAHTVAAGGNPTPFTMNAMRLATFAAQQLNPPPEPVPLLSKDQTFLPLIGGVP